MEKVRVDCPTCGELVWMAGVVWNDRLTPAKPCQLKSHTEFTEFTGRAPVKNKEPDDVNDRSE